ncbi:tetratricopeptide repeat protein [Rubripirellula amarantea]|uniref:Uncharacterized protein n=1 Tax=Rubripirellula amarantea TaxID=2527999 RepID=A0A5C5WMB0_9BACT|nr:tetratricopeptide repeat protein [Rubripirellula amarantea]MDA8743388.1 tetratricopeptide repeat protein [Rubripirellula amarantea]TWT51315.1 hypothetical protein Pla22_40920 [Rubripirellula amarantea]
MNDRRHELQENELAVHIGRINQSIEPYSKLIAVVVGALFIAGIAWLFYSTQQTEQRSDATLELIQAADSGDPEVLATVSDTYPGTIAGNWARVYQGNEYLAQGIDALYKDRENAAQLLGDARNAFSNSLVNASDPLLLSRAHFGLARTAESLGELDEAVEQYKKTIAIGESEAMIEKAQSRIDSLAKADTKQFLAWFADQDFSPAEPSLPPSLPDANELPDLPDLSLDLPELDLPGGEDSDVMDKESEMDLPSDESGEPTTPEVTAEPEMEAEAEPATETKPETAAAESASE